MGEGRAAGVDVSATHRFEGRAARWVSGGCEGKYLAEDFGMLLNVVVLVLVQMKVKLDAGFARSDDWSLAEQSDRM